MNTHTVCLTMIVKNESHVIERCLRSVAPFIDSFVIADTGSTDDTPEKILSLMQELNKPGKLVHHEWQDFGWNRTRVFEAARCADSPADYSLVIDADDILEFSDLEKAKRFLGPLDCYNFEIEMNGYKFKRPHLFRQSMRWFYNGTIHEYADCNEPFIQGWMHGVKYRCIGGGGRRAEPDKVDKEIKLLQKQLKMKPDDSRATFYLAQTYYDNWMVEEAIEWCEKVLTLKGWTEERFMSALRLGDLYWARAEMGDEDRAKVRYLIAAGINPNRAEPLERVARYFREQKLPGWAHISYLFAKRGSEIIPDPNGFLVDKACHESKIWDELSLAAFYSGRHDEAISACQKVIDSPFTSESVLERAKANMKIMTAHKMNILTASSLDEA